MSKIKKQAVSGMLWTSIRTIVTTLVGPLLLIVQARFLSPSEFGVLAVINIYLSLINIIENFGLNNAIIQREDISKDEISSLFFFQLILVSLITLTVVLSSPIISKIFDMPALNSLLPMLSIVVLGNGPIIVFTALLEKGFYFKELSIIQILRQILLFLSTVLFFLLGFQLMGIILGQIIAVIAMGILTLITTYKKGYLQLKVHFRISEIRPFIKFGLYIGGKQLMTQLTHHVDELIVGYFLSAEILGLYFFAKNLLNQLRTIITSAFSKILLPLLTRMQNDLKRLSRVYNLMTKYIGIFAFPIFIGVSLSAHLFVPLLFGQEWLGSVSFFRILSIAYIPYMITTNISTNLLYSIDKPNLVFKADAIVNVIYILLLLILTWLSNEIYGVVFLYGFYLIGKTMLLQYITQNQLQTSFTNYFSLFKSTFLASIIMMLIIFSMQLFLGHINNLLIRLTLTISLGAGSYILAYTLLDKKTVDELMSLLLKK